MAGKPTKVNRIFKEDMVIESDTFKLEVAHFSKNVSFDDKRPILVPVEHCHFYHTYDSGGKKMAQCNSVSGHTHDVSIEVDSKGNMTAICGPAKSNKAFEDNHTHKTTYIKSDRFKTRQIDQAAQQAIMNYEKI
jgi:hypothetical protein